MKKNSFLSTFGHGRKRSIGMVENVPLIRNIL